MTTGDGCDPREPFLEGAEGLPASAFMGDDPPPGFADAVFQRTVPAVRGRRLRRRAAAALALLAAFTAGWSGRALLSERPSGARIPARLPAAESPTLAAAPHPDPARETVPALRPLREVAVELKARGDRFLREDADVRSALECYRQHLEIAGSLGPVLPEPADSWLLEALKKPRS